MGHLLKNDFDVVEKAVSEAESVAARYGVPQALRTCHTAVVGGYVLEGHVPADVIWKLLADRPAITGLAVPGMPAGAPGMENQGRPAERYEVMAFDAQGRTSVYARR